jgi:predicted DNA-binding protein (UPF0278 family)
MSEVVPGEGTEGQEQEQVVSPVEQEAIQQGWVPKTEFQGEEHKWVDAGEFIRRGELFKKIEHQSHELKEVRKALHGFKEHYTKVKETEYNRALKELKAEFKHATREGEFDRADQLEAEIEAVEKEAVEVRREVDQVTQEATVHPVFAEWTAKNTWYTSQPHMKAFADAEGEKFARQGFTPSEVLKKVEAEVRKEFPTRFKNPNQDRPGAVEGTNSRGSTRTPNDGFKLDEKQERVMNALVRQGVMTKEEYIADIKKLGAK